MGSPINFQEVGLRATNAAIATSYDDVVYDPTAPGHADPNWVLGLARIIGLGHRTARVLDLGCGNGHILEAVGGATGASLLGIDISPSACARAERNLQKFGSKAAVKCADVMDLDHEELGKFDLIYLVGTCYVVPDAVRDRMLDFVGRCLDDGGIAVISYYSGSLHAVRADLHRRIRVGVRSHKFAERVGYARLYLQKIESEVLNSQDQSEMVLQAISDSLKLPDNILYHEVFSDFDAITTGNIERKLAPFGLQFVDYILSSGVVMASTSEERAVSADMGDARRGQYRYALFAKTNDKLTFHPTLPNLKWWTDLRFQQLSEENDQSIYCGQGGRLATLVPGLPNDLLRVLSGAERPLTFSEMRELAMTNTGASEIESASKTDIATALISLWRLSVAFPRAA